MSHKCFTREELFTVKFSELKPCLRFSILTEMRKRDFPWEMLEDISEIMNGYYLFEIDSICPEIWKHVKII